MTPFRIEELMEKTMIGLGDEEASSVASDLASLLARIDQELSRVSLHGVEPMFSPPGVPPLRPGEDIKRAGLSKDAVLKLAPRACDGFYVVPRG